jgi:hypothetical protein
MEFPRSIVIGLLGVSLIACGTPGQAVYRSSAPTTAASPSPTAAPSPTPSEVASPSGSLAAVTTAPAAGASSPPLACLTTQLEAVLLRVPQLMGNARGDYELRNRSGQACTLQGYVRLTQLDAQGRPLPTTLSQSNSSGYGPPRYPVDVALPPGTSPLGSGTTTGHAVFTATWAGGCDHSDASNTPAQWQLAPPGDAAALVISARPRDGSALATVCKGSVTVQPIQPG